MKLVNGSQLGLLEQLTMMVATGKRATTADHFLRTTKGSVLPIILFVCFGNIAMNMIRCSQIPHPPIGPASPLESEPAFVSSSAPANFAPVVTERSTETIQAFRKKENPTLLIHVGPTHTQAQDLVDDLRAIASELARDKIILADRTTERLLTNMECHIAVHKARGEFARKQTTGKLPPRPNNLKDYLVAHVPCWKHATVALQSHKERGESLVIVDEQLSKRNYHFQDLWLAPLDLIALETLSDDWNIELVVGYRRFSEWLPDAVEEHSRKRHSEKHPPATLPEPLFPDIVQGVGEGSLARINATYTDTLVERYNYRKTGVAKIPVSILNVHATGTLGQNIACNILQEAKHACGAAKKQRRVLKEQQQKLSPAQLEDFYGLIVSDASKRSAYRKKAASPEVAEIAVKYYQESILGKSAADLPMACPSKRELQGLLELSLAYEKKLLPQFARKAREQHRKGFWAANNKKATTSQRLCHVDMRKILHTKQWRLYMRQIPSKVPKHLLPHTFVQNQLEKKRKKSIIRGGKFLGMITTMRRKKSKS